MGGVTPVNREQIISFSKKSLAKLGLNMNKTQHMTKTWHKTKICKAIAHTIKVYRWENYTRHQQWSSLYSQIGHMLSPVKMIHLIILSVDPLSISSLRL